MDVLNVNAPFPLIVRLSVALFIRARPVLPLTRPLTVPPTVKGPALEPEPPLEVESVFRKLHPANNIGVINISATQSDFRLGLIRTSGSFILLPTVGCTTTS